MVKIAVIKIRSEKGAKELVKTTLKQLRLFRKNSCVIIPNKPAYLGMIKKVKDYVTWGEIDPETCKLLLEKRGKLPAKKQLTESYMKDKTKLDINQFVKEFFDGKKDLKDIPGLKLFFRLTPPVKGLERKGIKIPFSQGGALGYRKERINDLIKRMI